MTKSHLIFRKSRWQTFHRPKPKVEASPVDQRVYIAQLNIEHYRTKLTAERDSAKRETLQRLLAEEKAKLAALNDPPGEQKPRA